MGIDITEAVSEGATTIADLATGAAVSAAETATHPISTIRKQARRLERKGAPVNQRMSRRVNRQLDEGVETAEEIVTGALPERLALQGLRAIKASARRKDMVGTVAYSYLTVINSAVTRFAETLRKLEQASEPPTNQTQQRRVRRTTSRARSTARRSSRSASSSARTSARRTRSSARSGARRARTAEQKSA